MSRPRLPDAVPWPSHAYVPGQTMRHPEGWFDAIKATLGVGVSIEQTDAWRVGMAYFQGGYFWECHEVLEAAWMSLPNPSPQRDITQAMIQLANARLKHLMGKPRAVLRLCDIVDGLIDGHSGSILGLDVQKIAQMNEETRRSVV